MPTFGKTTQGSMETWSGPNILKGTKFRLNEPATIFGMGVILAPGQTTGHLKMAIFADAGNKAGALMTKEEAPVTVPAATTPLDVKVPVDIVTLPPGEYWFLGKQDFDRNWYRDDKSGIIGYHNNEPYDNDWSSFNQIPTVESEPWEFSIYAEYSVGPVPLTVAVSPATQAIGVGAQATVNAQAGGGAPPYSYQWYNSDNTPISGANSATLSITLAQVGEYGFYVVVTDSLGETVSSTLATVTVSETPPPTAILFDACDSLTDWDFNNGHAFPTDGYNIMEIDTVDKAPGSTASIKFVWASGGPTWGGGPYKRPSGASWDFSATPVIKIYAKVDRQLPTTGKIVWVLDVVQGPEWDSFSYDLLPTSLNPVGGLPVGVNYVVMTVDLRLHQARTDGKILNLSNIRQIGIFSWNEQIASPVTMHIDQITREAGPVLPLTVNMTPNVPVTIAQGGNQTFSAQVLGGVGPSSYQWYIDNVLQSGENTATFTFSRTTLGTFTVSCTVSDGVTTITVSQTITVTAAIIPTMPNAMLIYDQPWVAYNKNILDDMPKVIGDLSRAGCKYVILFIGYYKANDPTHPTVPWVRTAAFYRNVIDQLHAIGCKVIAWIENGSTEYGDGVSDISPANWANITPLITQAMNMGFDGYFDDIEVWTNMSNTGDSYNDAVANNQVQIAWLNYLTTFLHNGANFTDGKPRLNMPAVSFDWTQSLNQHLIVDYICSMFYDGAVPTTLEDPQCDGYWQENFGQYGGRNTPPASPMIVFTINWSYNNRSLSWHLNKLSTYILPTFPHPNLYGFGVWILEYMGTIHPEDWTVWDNWVTTLPAMGIPPGATVIQHVLSIHSTEGGTTDPAAGSYNLYENTTQQVAAIPNTDYMFDHWEIDGVNVGSTSPYSVTMDKDHDVLAVFVVKPPPPPTKQHLTISSTTGGTTTPAPGVWEYDQGSTAQATATPNAGYRFKQWTLDGGTMLTQATITVVMDADHALIAVFDLVPPTPLNPLLPRIRKTLEPIIPKVYQKIDEVRSRYPKP